VERSDSEGRSDAWPSRPDVVLFWEESRYSGKVVVEDCPIKVLDHKWYKPKCRFLQVINHGKSEVDP
jgi:hypothetical protein